MTRKGKPKNVAASVRARLLQLSKARREDFNYVLTQFGIERLLYRLASSEHVGEFVLKGAMLFTVWGDVQHRPTKDVDLLGHGAPGFDRLEAIFRDVCDLEPDEDDGVVFDAETITVSRIRDEEEYEGVRVKLAATLANAKIALQIDVGFGDAVTPEPIECRFPTLLDLPAPVLSTYPRETVVAEKLQAMVDLGETNSRLKDFFDVDVLAREYAFDGSTLVDAVRATFERRRTPLPSRLPLALTPAFALLPGKQAQWGAFLNKSKLEGEPDLEVVIERLAAFVEPVLAASRDEHHAWSATWSPGGPWT